MFPTYLTIINSPSTFPKDKAKWHVIAVTFFFFVIYSLDGGHVKRMTHAHRLTLSSRLTSVKVWVHFLTLSARAASSHRLLHPPEGPSALSTARTLQFAFWVILLVHLRTRMCDIVSHGTHAAVRWEYTELHPQQMMM